MGMTRLELRPEFHVPQALPLSWCRILSRTAAIEIRGRVLFICL
jgi:hypothetical protein